MNYIIAIDQGTTSSRTILFDEKCNIIDVAQMEISLTFPKSGWVEQNPDEIWLSVLETIKKIENKHDLNIILDIKENDKSDEYFGICKFLQESYKKDSNFGISEYVSYKLGKPLTILIREEAIE